jgi:hypothetical protein
MGVPGIASSNMQIEVHLNSISNAGCHQRTEYMLLGFGKEFWV